VTNPATPSTPLDDSSRQSPQASRNDRLCDSRHSPAAKAASEMAARVVAALEERLAVVLATAEAALDRQPW
jgi:hypothetical protein